MGERHSEMFGPENQDHYLLAQSMVFFNLDSPHQLFETKGVSIILTWENASQEK